jgi:hypothetical protein
MTRQLGVGAGAPQPHPPVRLCTHRHITKACSAVGSSFLFRVFESLECYFLDFRGSFDRIMMVKKQRLNLSKLVTICLQFSSTKWAKAYLVNYILEKLQESMGNMNLCSLSWIM